VLVGGGGEGLVGALEDALGTDVDPAPGGHLAVHGEAEGFEAAEFVPGGPFGDEHAVADEDARGVGVGLEHADGAAGLHEQGFVVFELLQGGDDAVEVGPAPGGAAGTAVDDELIGFFGDVGIEVVHEHAQGGFLLPALAGEGGAAGGVNGAGGSDGRRRGGHGMQSLLRSGSGGD
jgi:hypothetical protein